MKKIFLTIAIFSTVNNFAFSQEEQDTAKSKPPSRIGATVGYQFIGKAEDGAKTNDGKSFSLFFHQTISPLWFLSFDAGYQYHTRIVFGAMEIKSKGSPLSAIPINVGMNLFLTKSGIQPYLGIELGLFLDNAFVVSFGPTFGISVPITNNINLGANIKMKYLNEAGYFYGGITGINTGISYSIPKKQKNNLHE